MSLKKYEAFVRTVDLGSLTKAAQDLGSTQSRISHILSDLELEYGFCLMRRSRGGIELTEAGEHFLPLAYRWQTLLEETKGVAETATREYLRIGAVFSTNQYILPAAYRRFLHRKLPVALWVQTLRGAGYDGAQTVARRELEMALMDGDSFYHPQLELTPLCSEETVVACSPDSPYGDVISPKELDPSNEIVVSWRKAVQDWRDHWFGLTATPLLYADSMQAVDTFLGNEMMWAVVPLAAARALEQAGRARICHLTDPAPERVSYLMTRRGEALSPAAQLLLEDIRTEIQRIEGVHMVQ